MKNFLNLGLESSIPRNIRIFFLEKHKKFFIFSSSESSLLKYKKKFFSKTMINFFRVGFFYFLSLESSHLKYKKFFKPGVKKFHSRKYKENFI